MNRRELLKTGVLSTTAYSLSGSHLPGGDGKEYVLENDALSWRLGETSSGIRSIRFVNKLSGRSYDVSDGAEWRAVWASSAQRLEIPWWDFQPGSEDGAVRPEEELGISRE